MRGTTPLDPVPAVELTSLPYVTGGFVWRADGSLQYDGDRPGVDWHAHGYFARWLWVLVRGATMRVRLHKRRWLDTASGRTRHSRPPMEVGAVSVCSLALCLELWAWLASGSGVHVAPRVVVDPRTRQRWLRRFGPRALAIQQAIRRALLDRCEPRPLEDFFPRGVPPPADLVSRRWSAPATVCSLWRALFLLWTGVQALSVSAAVLLAEARRRDAATDTPTFP